MSFRRLDPVRFPYTSAYLAALPRGLESYPACTVHPELFQPLARDFTRLAHEPGLPSLVADLFEGRQREARSEVLFQTANLVIRDLGFSDDAGHHQWTYDVTRELFDKPLLRPLMRLISPTLIVMGSAKRWSAFHQGSTLVAEPVHEAEGRVHTTSRLTFPEHLFSTLFLHGLVRAFEVAVSGARGEDTRVELGVMTSASAEYRVSFKS